MMKARGFAKVVTVALAVWLIGSPSAARAGTADATGTCRMLWSRHHATADYTSAAISQPVACLSAGTEGNPAPVELIPLEGTGDPEWVFAGTEFYVAAARDADVFVALDYDEAAQTVTVYKWHASSAVPDWSYTIFSCTLYWPEMRDTALVVSADGSTICVLVQKESDPIYSRMYCFDADTGSVLCTNNSPDGFAPLRIAVSRYGDYIAYSAINMDTAFGRVFTITRDSCNNYWTGLVLTLGAGLCLSPDGEYLVHDVLTLVPLGVRMDVRKWRDFPAGYPVECSHDQPDRALISSACSWDFSTVVSGWASLEDPPEPSEIKLFEMPDCDPVWTYAYPSNGDGPVAVALTTDGSYAAVGNFTDPDTNPEILVFEHASSQPVGTVDTSDGVYWVDIAHATCGGAYLAACDGDLHLVRVYEGVITVCPDGSADYTTIQDGIDAASDGYLVELCDATFVGPGNRNIDFLGKAITVRSESGNPEDCVIHGQQGVGLRGFRFATAEGPCSLLEGVTIKKFGAIDGAGIYCDGASPTISNCIATENATSHAGPGGGMYCRNSSATVLNCTISANAAHDGGGIYCDGACSMLTITGCVISGNYATNDGGAIYCNDASPHLFFACTISGNRASHFGGGLYAFGAGTDIYLENSIIWDNCADGGEGDEWYCDGGAVRHCCCDANSSGAGGSCPDFFCPATKPNTYEDPSFCVREPCGNAPTVAGDYHLYDCSPAAPEQQPDCGLIGALDFACFYERCPNRGEHGKYCSADIDGSDDCIVNLADLARLLSNYPCTSGCTHEMGDVSPHDPNCPAGDGLIGLADLAELLSQYGDNCNWPPEP